MGQPPPPHGPQGPYPGRPGQPGQPLQGPPPGYGQYPPQGPPGQPGQYPPQGPPPGYGQAPQGPPPGYGQQPPQGPPGQFPPQGPPGQYPPGHGPQGAAPKKKTGLIIGGAAAALLLVGVIGGILVFASSSSEYASLPDNCSEAIGSSVLNPLFEGGSPALDGGFSEGTGTYSSSYGTLTCEGESGGSSIMITAELVDLGDSAVKREFEADFDGTELTDGLTTGHPEPGEIKEEDLGFGATSSFLWNHTNVGDQSVVMAMTTDTGDQFAELEDLGDFGDFGDFGGPNGVAMGVFITDNIATAIVLTDGQSGRGVQDLFNTMDSVSGDLAKQLERVAD